MQGLYPNTGRGPKGFPSPGIHGPAVGQGFEAPVLSRERRAEARSR